MHWLDNQIKGNIRIAINKGVGMRIVLLSVALIALSACGQSDETKDQMNSIAHVRVAKEKVQKSLIDPNSAEFRDVHVYRNGKGKIVCGFVNAKNRFGGFTGFEEFIVIGDAVALKSQGVNDFNTVWSDGCANRNLIY